MNHSTRGTTSAARIGVLLACFVLCGPPAATAQRVFSLGDWSGLIDFGFDHDGQLTSLGETPLNLLTRNRFTQRVRARNSGFVFAQRLAVFTPSFTLGFTQDDLSTGGESGLLVSDVLAYDLSAMLLPDKPYNLRLFTSKSDTFAPLRFGGSTSVDVSNRGATLNLMGSVLHSTFAYWERRLQVQSTGIGSQDRHEFRKNLSYRGTANWSRNDLSLRLELEDVDDKMFPEFSFASRTADAYHRYQLGSSNAGTVTSSLRQLHRGGRLREDLIALEEALHMRINQSLSSEFSYRYRGRDRDDRNVAEHRTIAGVNHRLYDSLQTTAQFQLGLQDRDDGGRKDVGARVAVAYRKDLPWDARLTTDWVFRYEQHADRSDTGDRLITDEGHVAHLGLPFQLEYPHVIESSVVVTDANARTIFVPGVDYQLRTIGSFSEITPSVDGAIDDGEILHIEYRVLTPREVRFELRQRRVGFGFQRGILSASYTYDRSTSGALDGDDEGLLVGDTTVHVGAVTITRRNPRTPMTLSSRYRRQIQSQLDFSSLRFSQMLRFSLNSHFVLGIDANQEFTDFRVPERRTSRMTGRSTLQWSVMPGLRVSALLALRQWSDTLSVDETFFEAGARAEWTLPRFDLRTSITRQYRWRGDTGYSGIRLTLRASRAF